MESNAVYALRQAFLLALADAFGPATLDRLKNHVELFGVDPSMLIDQFRRLIAAGYIEEFPGTGGKYVKLSDKGSAQREFVRGKADVFIWGPKAL